MRGIFMRVRGYLSHNKYRLLTIECIALLVLVVVDLLLPGNAKERFYRLVFFDLYGCIPLTLLLWAPGFVRKYLPHMGEVRALARNMFIAGWLIILAPFFIDGVLVFFIFIPTSTINEIDQNIVLIAALVGIPLILLAMFCHIVDRDVIRKSNVK